MMQCEDCEVLQHNDDTCARCTKCRALLCVPCSATHICLPEPNLETGVSKVYNWLDRKNGPAS